MPEWKRVGEPFKVLWTDGDCRMIRRFIVYGCHDEYTGDYPCPKTHWEIEQRNPKYNPDFDEWGEWLFVKAFWGGEWYHLSRGNGRRGTTQVMAQRGREWLFRHKQLLAAPMWTIQCLSIDGQDTACPIYQPDTRTCGAKFFYLGYSGGPACRPAPGVCDAPNHEGACLPTLRDRYGNPLAYYQEVLRKKELANVEI